LVFIPNPKAGETTVLIEPKSSGKSPASGSTVDYSTEWDMEVYDTGLNLKIQKVKVKGNSTQIQTTDWNEGIYFVRAKFKDETLSGKLVVKK
jgi:hypothetical protein